MATESDKLIIGENSLIVNSPFANESCPKFMHCIEATCPEVISPSHPAFRSILNLGHAILFNF